MKINRIKDSIDGPTLGKEEGNYGKPGYTQPEERPGYSKKKAKLTKKVPKYPKAAMANPPETEKRNSKGPIKS